MTEAKSFPVVDAYSLVEFLAVKKNFTGNVENYYSLSSSLFNQVLSSKSGIPMSVALVYLSVVQKLNSDAQFLETQHLDAWGVNFPEHFLAAVSDGEGEHLIDRFKGYLVTIEECYSINAYLYGRHNEPDDRYFERADSSNCLDAFWKI